MMQTLPRRLPFARNSTVTQWASRPVLVEERPRRSPPTPEAPPERARAHRPSPGDVTLPPRTGPMKTPPVGRSVDARAPDVDASCGSTAAQSPKERQEPIAGQLVPVLDVGLGQLAGQVNGRAPLTEHIAAPEASGEVLVNAGPHVSWQGVLQVRGNELHELLARQIGRG